MQDRRAEAESHRRMLGVTSPFGLSELRTHYIRLIKEHHPDRFFGDHSQYATATEKTKSLNLSFQFLSEYLEDLGGTYTFAAKGQTVTGKERESPKYEYRPRYTYEGERYEEGLPDGSVTEVFLKSSHIVSTGYNSRERVLYIKFKGNDIYRYDDVPQSTFDAFLSAQSHGKFAHQNIYRSFRYRRV